MKISEEKQAVLRKSSHRAQDTALRRIRWGIAVSACVLGSYWIWSGLQSAFLFIRIWDATSIRSIALYQPQQESPYHTDDQHHIIGRPYPYVVLPKVPFRQGEKTLRVDLELNGHRELRTCTIEFTVPRCFAEVYIASTTMQCGACVHD